jgi:hypothetical protein
MSDTIPCVTLPSLSGIPKIPLLGGAELRGFVDPSLGPATDCRVNVTLLLQVAPYLANLACVIKLMNVIAKIKDFANAATDPITKLPGAVPALVDSINQLQGCIPFLVPLDLLAMLKGILQMILSFLNCLVSQIKSVLEFRATLDLSAVGDNDTLRSVLECAQANADAAMTTLKQAMDPLQPILQMISVIADIAGQPIAIALPDLSNITAGGDVSQALQPLMDTIAAIESVVDAIPG